MTMQEMGRVPEGENLQFLQDVLTDVSEIARRNFGRTTSISTKDGDNNQVLTETDLEIGKLIVDRIQETFPTHNIIDEEAGVIDKGSEHTWIVDPVDGTSNFANRVPLFGTIIGKLYKNKAVVGGVALPMFSEIYLAEQGRGAFCNGEKLGVTSEQNLLAVLVGYSLDGHQENPQLTYEECALLADIILGCRNLRTSGSIFDAMQVAKGNYGAYHHRNTKIWDIVGMQVIIEEAGGVFTNFDGSPVDYTDHLKRAKDKYPFSTAAPEIHRQLQEIIHRSKVK